MSIFHTLTISEVDRSTADTVLIHFSQPPFGRIHYLPGQYLTLRIERDGEAQYRSYSLCSAPRLDMRLSIGVKRVVGGLVSNFLVDQAQPGMELEVMEPRGRFYLDNSVKETRHVVLMGGGSGMTPLFSILRSTLYNEPNSIVSLFLANRDQPSMMFHQELKRLQQRFGRRLHQHHHFSASHGRANGETIAQWLQDLPVEPAERIHFLCGPEGLMKVFRQTLLQQSVPEAAIHQEHFFESEAEKRRREHISGHTRKVAVSLAGETHQFTVPPGSTVLDAALDRGLALPHSCKQGTCASCLATLEAGTVMMVREDALLDFERARGKILSCQAVPQDDEVQIRF